MSRNDLDDLDRAIADGEAHGFIKVLTVPGRDRILGTIHIYPTLAEANKYVAGVCKKAHAPAEVLRWLDRSRTWRRGGG